jgi:Regulator of ribonuclease activity B
MLSQRALRQHELLTGLRRCTLTRSRSATATGWGRRYCPRPQPCRHHSVGFVRHPCHVGILRKRSRPADASPSDDAPVDPDERSPQLGVKFKDLAVMGQLIDHGADMSKPRNVVYYNYAPTAAVARTMANAATAQGFRVEIREPLPQFPDQWSVICQVDAVVDPALVRHNTDFFEELASLHDAEYDGWEAAI